MPSLADAQSSNSNYSPLYVPTAVFIGGTSGIGRAMAEALVSQTKGRVRIVIVGRNKAAAEEIIASFPTPPSNWKHKYVACDATELKNVRQTTQELLQELEKINILVFTPGCLTFSRHDTPEGHDAGLVLRYYARAKFTVELLPLLERARAAGEDARMMTILAAARGQQVDLQDPGLKKWSFSRVMAATATYNDAMVKVLSEEHPNVSFMHVFPGLVDTPAMRFNWWISTVTSVLKAFGIVVTADVCAQFMLYPLLSPDFASGGYWLNKHGEPMALPANVTKDVSNSIWKHTREVIDT